MLKRVKFVALLLVLAFLFSMAAGCGPSNAPKETKTDGGAGEVKQYAVGTSTAGGLMYVVGAGWANLMNDAFKGKYNFTAEETPGNNANVDMIENGELEFCTNGVFVIAESYAGEADWTGGTKYKKMRVMLPLNQMTLTAYTSVDSGIKSMSDLHGKRVGVGNKGAAIDNIARRFFAERGIEPAMIHNDGWSATANALKDGIIDAVITMQKAPAAAILEIQSTVKLYMIPFSEEDLAVFKKQNPSFSASVLPKGCYDFVTEDIPSLSDWSTISCSADVPDEVVYELVKATFEHTDEFKLVHNALDQLSYENAQYITALLHPGAKKYYEEMGVNLPEPVVVPLP